MYGGAYGYERAAYRRPGLGSLVAGPFVATLKRAGRMISCVVEQNHDENGIIWPATVAPFHVHLLTLGESEDVRAMAEEVYEAMRQWKEEYP